MSTGRPDPPANSPLPLQAPVRVSETACRNGIMNDKSGLLNDLRIDRGGDAGTAPRSGRLLAPVLLLGLAVAGAAWWFAGPARSVPVSTATAMAMQPEAGPAQRAAGASALDASGYVVARRQATVSAKVTGRVVEMLIEEGQRVSAGEVVARLDDANALAALQLARAQHAHAEAQFAAARTALEDARPIFERSGRQFSQGIISDQEHDGARATFHALEAGLAVSAQALEVAAANVALAEINHEDTIVRAPFDGVITVTAAQRGEIVSPVSAGGGFTRTGIGTIVDMNSLEVVVDVSESHINRVRAGQAARVRLNAYADREIPADVIAVIPTADRARATVRVRVGFREVDERVLPDMGARVSFLGAAADANAAPPPPSGVLLPNEAVIVEGGLGTVYLIRERRLERRSVQLGSPTAGGQVVVEGLWPGARVALGDLDRLADGMKVRVSD